MKGLFCTLLLTLLLVPRLSLAQEAPSCDETTLAQAERELNRNAFEAVSDLLEPCLTGRGFTSRTLRANGHRLVAIALLEDGNLAGAEAEIKQLFKVNRRFRATPTDPLSFRQLAEEHQPAILWPWLVSGGSALATGLVLWAPWEKDPAPLPFPPSPIPFPPSPTGN